MQGQVTIVTGGAKGIGRYIAHGFAKAGAKVAIADIDTARLEQTGKELEGMTSGALSARVDVRNEDEVREFIAQVASRFGQIDVLVNNAAIVPHFNWGVPKWALIRDMEKTFWERAIQTTLGGTFLCTKHVIPYMEKRRSGHILNVHGGGSEPGACAYVVTKEAIRSFTRMVADEVHESNICVVIVAPEGPFATEDAPEEARRRMKSPADMGDRFLLAAEAGMEVSGQLVNLKDGRLNIRTGPRD